MTTEVSSTPITLSSITLFPPNSNDKSLSSESINYNSLLGTWHVVASTLPLWKDKKNVKITYTSLPSSLLEPITTFDDLVEYNKLSDPVGKSPSTVRGIDRLDLGGKNEVSWKWRGKGLLYPITSKWQLLGFNLHSPSPSPSPSPSSSSPSEPEYVITYFASTLFTPSGLDIYSRTKKGLGDDVVEKLVEALDGLGGEVRGLVSPAKGKKGEGMFRIPHDE